MPDNAEPATGRERRTLGELWRALPDILKQLTALVGAISALVLGYLAYAANPTPAPPHSGAAATGSLGVSTSTPTPTTAGVHTVDPPAPTLSCFAHKPISHHLHCFEDTPSCELYRSAACNGSFVFMMSWGKPQDVTAITECAPPELLVGEGTAVSPPLWLICPS